MQVKPYKNLKPKQKTKLWNMMCLETKKFLDEHHHLPETDEEILAVVTRIQVRFVNGRVAIDEIRRLYERFLIRKGDSILVNGLPEHLVLQEKKREMKKVSKTEKKPKKKKRKGKNIEESWKDDTFAMILGYTSGGAPYGVTWEEMKQKDFKDSDEKQTFSDKLS